MIDVVPGKFISADEAVEFINKVADMRDLQRAYFAYRDNKSLQQAKALEREIDKRISQIRSK